MNREIKFRAWDKGLRKMVYKVNLYSINGTGEMNKAQLDNKQFMSHIGFHCEVMQYIGRKDINGIDVYEGDIVEVLSNGTVYRKAKVVYDGGMCLWKVEVNSNHFIDLNFIGNNIKIGRAFRVIGNVHENPQSLNL